MGGRVKLHKVTKDSTEEDEIYKEKIVDLFFFLAK